MTYRLIVLFAMMLVLINGGQANADSARFPDPLVVRVSDDGDTLTLQSDFTFVDNRGKRWTARRGTVVNGASIPRLFWTVIGAPFTGKHRKASVIHDYYCDQRITPWQRVHEVFTRVLWRLVSTV